MKVRVLLPIACCLVVVNVATSCALVVEAGLSASQAPDGGAAPAALDPARFTDAECTPETANLGGSVVLGVVADDGDAFTPFGTGGDDPLALQEIDDGTWGAVSLRTSGLALQELCVEVRVEIEEQDAPAELVSFRRVVVTLAAGAEGGELDDLATRFVNPAAARDKHVKITVAAADSDGVSAVALSRAVVR